MAERIMYHGTSESSAMKIKQEGFQYTRSKLQEDTLKYKGCFFTSTLEEAFTYSRIATERETSTELPTNESFLYWAVEVTVNSNIIFQEVDTKEALKQNIPLDGHTNCVSFKLKENSATYEYFIPESFLSDVVVKKIGCYNVIIDDLLHDDGSVGSVRKVTEVVPPTPAPRRSNANHTNAAAAAAAAAINAQAGGAANAATR